MRIVDNIERFFLLAATRHVLAVEGTEIREERDVRTYFNAVLLKKDRNTIAIQNSVSNVDRDTLIGWIQAKVPLEIPFLLNVNSDKIIHKIIDSEIIDEGTIIRELIPDADPDSFYCQVFPFYGNKKFVSIVRKSSIDNLVESLSAIQEAIIGISVGPFSIFKTYQHLFRAGNENEFEIRFANYFFLIRDNDVLDYSISSYTALPNQDFISIGVEKIPVSNIITYSLGLSYFLQPMHVNDLKVVQARENNSEYKFRVLSKMYGIVAGISVFSILIVSSILFTIYSSKYQELELMAANNRLLWDKYQANVANRKKATELLANNGLINESNIAYYADQLTSELPDSVYLHKVEIHPINTRAASDNLEFSSNRIYIEGYCYTTGDLSAWVSILKKYKWVKNVLIKDYKQGEDLGMFTIEILKYHEK